MHEQSAGLGRVRNARLVGVIEDRAPDLNPCAPFLELLDLVFGDDGRHEDRRRDSKHMRGARNGKAVIAARCRHQTGLALDLRARQHPVHGAARLERTGHLQALELKDDGAFRLVGFERRERDRRRAAHVRPDARLGGADIVDGDHGALVSWLSPLDLIS